MMNNVDSTVSDTFIPEFSFNNFENVSIKPELMCQHLADHGNGAYEDAPTATPPPGCMIPGLSEAELIRATSSTTTDQHLHQASPLPHPLTPPESQSDQCLIVPNMMMSRNCNYILPGTLPVTGSDSPTLAPAYYCLEHYQPQHQQLLQHLHPSAGVASEGLWMPQPPELQIPRHEPLDLRPGLSQDRIHSWSTRQHTSIITGTEQRTFRSDYFQSPLEYRQAGAQRQALSPQPATNSSNILSSVSLSLTSTKSLVTPGNGIESQARYVGSRASAHSRTRDSGRTGSPSRSSRSGGAGKIQSTGFGVSGGLSPDSECKKIKFQSLGLGLTDDQLVQIKVPELNKMIKALGLDNEDKKIVRDYRRMLLNRGYAKKCRSKRVDEGMAKDSAISKLEAELMAKESMISKLEAEMRTKNSRISKLEAELMDERLETSMLESTNSRIQEELRWQRN